jgi:outer membrane autotransporter protein
LPSLRFDAAVARSGITYNGVAGAAAGSFPGSRWLANAGLAGLYEAGVLEIEPSAKVYAVREHEDAYLDSLGTQHDENNFSTGRASGGAKLAYPMAWGGMTTLAPYVGLYADYYFSSDNAAPLPSTQFIQGWAARLTTGLTYDFAGAQLSLGGELGGIGSQNFTTWAVRGRASVPF